MTLAPASTTIELSVDCPTLTPYVRIFVVLEAGYTQSIAPHGSVFFAERIRRVSPCVSAM